MEKLIAFDLYRLNTAGGHEQALPKSFAGYRVYLAPGVEALIHAAQATLTEQRREFARGEIADLDVLEDAINALMERSSHD